MKIGAGEMRVQIEVAVARDQAIPRGGLFAGRWRRDHHQPTVFVYSTEAESCGLGFVVGLAIDIPAIFPPQMPRLGSFCLAFDALGIFFAGYDRKSVGLGE